MIKVLIGSNGGLTGIYLAKQYRRMTGIIVYGADSSSMNTGKFFVNKQFLLPHATHENFIEKLIAMLNENSVDIYLPTHSKEIKIVSKNSDIIRSKSNARFLVTPAETFSALDNKKVANQKLKEVGIPVPQIIEDIECEYPIIMKNDIGSGSINSIKIANKEIHAAFRNTCKNVSFYRMVQGKEYTLDCMFDDQGKLIGYNQRERIKTIGGAVSITSNSNEIDVRPWLEKLANTWKFCGCVNFQYIVQNGIPYFIDINLRYPSGGLPLSVASGLDIPKLTIDVLLSRPYAKFVLSEEKNKFSMYRYFEEIFE